MFNNAKVPKVTTEMYLFPKTSPKKQSQTIYPKAPISRKDRKNRYECKNSVDLLIESVRITTIKDKAAAQRNGKYQVIIL